MSEASTPFIQDLPYVYPLHKLHDFAQVTEYANRIPSDDQTWDSESGKYNLEIEDSDVVLQEIIHTTAAGRKRQLHSFVRAGPRPNIVFKGEDVHAAIVTCGGICPGINNVIRDIVLYLWHNYRVRRISGIRNGYRGFYQPDCQPPMELNPKVVDDIHNDGGTLLGSTRGGFNKDDIMRAIEEHGYNVVFCVGGDGTMRGAMVIFDEVRKVQRPIVVCVVPKTIDNDIPYFDRTFGFNTAVAEATKAIKCAKVEARCSPKSIVIVQLMGRAAGFIAMEASLASSDVDLLLIPEVSFVMDGPSGVFEHLDRRLKVKGHAVVVVAEGAGQHVMESTGKFDESGNPVLPEIGQWLKKQISTYFKSQKMTVPVRFIDPSYMIRAVPANSSDCVYCMLLASQAVHGAMAGLTGFSVGLVNDRTVYAPMELLTSVPLKRVNVTGRMWDRTLMMTRQPRWTGETNAEFRELSSPPSATAMGVTM